MKKFLFKDVKPSIFDCGKGNAVEFMKPITIPEGFERVEIGARNTIHAAFMACEKLSDEQSLKITDGLLNPDVYGESDFTFVYQYCKSIGGYLFGYMKS